jgi:type IV pilus assembly protein PilP
MMKRHAIQVVWGGVLMFLLAGGTGAAWSWAAEVKAVPPPAPATVSHGGPAAKAAQTVSSAPAAAPAPSPAYSYQAAGKADPFVPFIELDLALKKKKEEELKKSMTLKTAEKKLPVSPLQQAEVGQFRLVGIAGDDQIRTAVVEDGVAKKYYPLFVGTYIGLNGGRVVSILPDRVIVEERLQDQTKKVRKAEIRRIPIMLHKEEEGKP